MRRLASTLALLPALAGAHDIWIETSTNVVRTGDWLGLSLMLGNHGNEHRDFKFAGKVAPEDRGMEIIGPRGFRRDLKSALVDQGFTLKEGFWSTRFTPNAPGLYTAVSRFDRIMSYGPVRDVRCAKAYFLANASLDRVPQNPPGFDRPVGAPFELIPLTNPVAPLGSGRKFKVRVLFRGHPRPGVRIGFVPRGATAKGGLDPDYERTTDADGTASLVLREPNDYLVAAHLRDDAAKGPGYDTIDYSATIYLRVPGTRPFRR